MGAEKLNDDRRWKDMELIQSYVFVESEIKVAVLQKLSIALETMAIKFCHVRARKICYKNRK